MKEFILLCLFFLIELERCCTCQKDIKYLEFLFEKHMYVSAYVKRKVCPPRHFGSLQNTRAYHHAFPQ